MKCHEEGQGTTKRWMEKGNNSAELGSRKLYWGFGSWPGMSRYSGKENDCERLNGSCGTGSQGCYGRRQSLTNVTFTSQWVKIKTLLRNKGRRFLTAAGRRAWQGSVEIHGGEHSRWLYTSNLQVFSGSRSSAKQYILKHIHFKVVV